jgi:hypothetical protein
MRALVCRQAGVRRRSGQFRGRGCATRRSESVSPLSSASHHETWDLPSRRHDLRGVDRAQGLRLRLCLRAIADRRRDRVAGTADRNPLGRRVQFGGVSTPIGAAAIWICLSLLITRVFLAIDLSGSNKPDDILVNCADMERQFQPQWQSRNRLYSLCTCRCVQPRRADRLRRLVCSP